MVYSNPRSIIIDALIILPPHPPPPQDDRFSPRIVSRLKAVGFIRAKGNVAYNGEKAFSWGGKGVVSCQVYDVFLISFIDATGIRVSG